MPPEVNAAYLEVRLSGGAGNTDPDASLGGIMSSERVYSQSASAPTLVTGVVIDDGKGNALGDGTLTFIYIDGSVDTLQWTPNAGTIGDAVIVGADGRYVIADSTGDQQVHVTVTDASLPGSSQSDTDITIANITNEVFDDIVKQESLDGDTEYRCLYLYNAHPTDQVLNSTIWRESDASGADSLSLAADLAGVGDGSTTGVADTVVDEGTAPDPALSFTEPTTQGAGIILGTLDSGEAVAFWEKRVVPAETSVSTAIDLSDIGIAAYK